MARNPLAVEKIAQAVGLKVWPSFIERASDDRREKFYNGGWRGSKTYSADFDAVIVILTALLHLKGKHLIWLIGPDYEQARPDYFNLLEWFEEKLGLFPKSSEAQEGSLTMFVQQPGLPGILEIVTKSANKPQTLGAVAPKFIIACEAGQMPETARDRIRGRASTYNAPIIWNGTFENDEGKTQYAWFEEESKRYKDNPTPRRKSYSLPIWENIALFGDCREMIEEDPTLIPFCPDDNHGPAHSGIDFGDDPEHPSHPDLIPGTSGVPRHPKVRELYEECRDKPTYWRKYYAGEPVGVLNPVYEWATTNPEHYLRPMPKELKDPNYRWLRSALGADFGTIHPSAVTLISVAQDGRTWVRRSEKDTSGSLNWVWTTLKQWRQTYHVAPNMIGRDPMVKYAPDYVEGEAMSGSLYAREARVGVVNGVVQNDCLFFDGDDPGVRLLFREIQLVHRRKQPNGSVGYDRREGEDMAASWEDAMAMAHGQPITRVSNKTKLRRRSAPRELVTPVRV